ncbi:MAG: bifunctional diaminohydroxyphosphoribosylaminopyrimidine deaminase/5-amino-6-(5-phosphoribosylamino)uracil reductase RibD [Myxococcota bacterium]|nr:bifunctional diaminohydroxyphosphoribosylaminopyrimidine deaminase/5-amino-6-(5-phosphoribosylamino)uracil reductase RibD [Myxococcota bacterium]
MTEDERFMTAALQEGRKALPACQPNPPVGCVLVRGGKIVARGHTQPPYRPHAEPMAMSQLDGSFSEVTAYVTLEPCSFHNRTPSCARELVARGVGRVVIAMADPHPRNRGAGVRILVDGGIPVTLGILEATAQADLAPYIWQASLDDAAAED